MTRRGRHRKGGRVTPKGTRPLSYQPRRHHDREWSEPEPDLLGDVRRAAAGDDPLPLLALASSLLAAVDPRGANPFETAEARSARLSREELIRSFLDVDRPETSLLLAAIAALSANDIGTRRIARELDRRGHPLPRWLATIDAVEAYRTQEMTHVLGDGDNVLVGVRFPDGHELTAVAYIDHNLGTLVKDAFIVDEPIDELVSVMRATADDPYTTVADLPLADAKVRIVEAIEIASMTYPPFESDTWPACRALLEWMVRLLPDGGRGYERPEWSDDDRQQLIDRFFASPFGASLDDGDHRDLLDTFLWFGCDYGPGDPLRWSPVAVEILLLDWLPRKVVASASYLRKAPDLLRAFVRFCHAERHIPSPLTDETLQAVDRWEPEYQRTIRAPRPQGPAALLARLGALDPDGPWGLPDDSPFDDEPWDYGALMLSMLERTVGGPEALEALDDAPLPDEPFAWDGIPDDIHDRVAEVLAMSDRCCDELLGVECRTAARRVLARIASRDPEVFRRRGRADTAAAAVCWIVARINDRLDQRPGRLTQKALLAHFGLTGSISQRAGTLLKAGGFPTSTHELTLGSPDYLVSARRRAILDTRERFAP